MIVDLCRMDDRKARLARSIPGVFADYRERVWKLNTAANEQGVRVAMESFHELRPELEMALASTETVADTRPLDAATPWAAKMFPSGKREDMLPNLYAHDDAWIIADNLYNFQVRDVAFGSARLEQDGGMYYGHDRGLGKTLMAIATAVNLDCKHVVVVCPNSAKIPVWRDEISRWLPRAYTHVIQGDAAKRDRALDVWSRVGGFLMVHYEALRLVDWKLYPADMVVVDEAHRLSNGNAGPRAPQFYKALKKIKAHYRLALSGSVLVNSPEDIFGAIHWLFPAVYRSKERDWCSRYVRYAEGSGFKVCIGVKPDKLADMRAELGTFLIVRRKEDELDDLPELIEQTLHVDLGPEQRRVYDELAHDLIAQLPSGDRLVVSNWGAQQAMLRKVATGLTVVDDDTVEVVDDVKLDTALDLVRDNVPNKTVVFCWHRAVADRMADKLGPYGVAKVHGGVGPKTRDAEIERFKTDDDCHVLVATIATLSESQNFQVANQVVFVEPSWTDVGMKQARDRVYRNGQKQRVTVVTIVSRGTIDTRLLLPKIASKEQLANMILGG